MSGGRDDERSEAPPGSEKPSPSCEECRFSLRQDEGWSNYTVEGTAFFCMIGAHPDDGFDAWYGTDKRLGFAAECPKFEVGKGVDMDCDRENLEDLGATERALYDAWSGGSEE